MKTSDMVQSKFLKKDDFQTPTILTIKSVSLEEVGRGEERWVIFFNERAKGIVLNVTKIRQLENKYGQDTDDWIGKRVVLYTDPNVSYAGKIVGGIRVRAPKLKAPPEPEPEPIGDEGFDDDPVPF